MKWWKVEVGIYILAGIGQLIAALVNIADEDWLKPGTSAVFALVLLVAASKTSHIEMLTKALTKSVFAHAQHKEHADCSRQEECSDESR